MGISTLTLMMKMRNYYYFIILILLVVSCKTQVSTSGIGEDFDVFYDRFHQDRQFQMERVQFPLEGRNVDADGERSWTRDTWEMHKQKVTAISEPGYDTEIIRKQNEVTDKVKLRDSGFYAERHFEKIRGKWYLVYYESVNL